MNPTEQQVQTQIMNYLQAKNFYVERINSGKYAVGEGKAKRFIRGAAKGTPDILAFKKIRCEGALGDRWEQPFLLFVEVKKKGNKPTLSQTMKMQELRDHGAICVVAYSIEDLERAGI